MALLNACGGTLAVTTNNDAAPSRRKQERASHVAWQARVQTIAPHSHLPSKCSPRATPGATCRSCNSKTCSGSGRRETDVPCSVLKSIDLIDVMKKRKQKEQLISQYQEIWFVVPVLFSAHLSTSRFADAGEHVFVRAQAVDVSRHCRRGMGDASAADRKSVWRGRNVFVFAALTAANQCIVSECLCL